MCWSVPTPEEQVRFLRSIQRLLGEGLFVASYKFALLHALADLAVEKGDDSGAPLEMSTEDIADKYIDLYWRQCRPYQIGGTTTELILHQNKGSQAEIVSKVAQAQRQYGGSLFRFKTFEPKQWSRLLSAVRQVASGDPLHRLQNVGNDYICFLYDIHEGERRITLKPGVAYCLRAFYELLRDLIQGAWVRFIQKVNAAKLGNVIDLGTFLFGQDRSNLEVYRPILRDVQRGECFYCHQQIEQAARSIISSRGHAIRPTWDTTSSSPTPAATTASRTIWRPWIILEHGRSGTACIARNWSQGSRQQRSSATCQLPFGLRRGPTSRRNRPVGRCGL